MNLPYSSYLSFFNLSYSLLVNDVHGKKNSVGSQFEFCSEFDQVSASLENAVTTWALSIESAPLDGAAAADENTAKGLRMVRSGTPFEQFSPLLPRSARG